MANVRESLGVTHCRLASRRVQGNGVHPSGVRQLAVSLIGPMNVTRAVLPVMRRQRSGHIISISSSAGLAAGFDFVSAYAASKFGLEGWMESLHAEVAPFGITTTIVDPELLRSRSDGRVLDRRPNGWSRDAGQRL
jgi:NAD(P)-dependent dehydrogenase (short-subunit alcohol dehydrogenase family)